MFPIVLSRKEKILTLVVRSTSAPLFSPVHPFSPWKNLSPIRGHFTSALTAGNARSSASLRLVSAFELRVMSRPEQQPQVRSVYPRAFRAPQPRYGMHHNPFKVYLVICSPFSSRGLPHGSVYSECSMIICWVNILIYREKSFLTESFH